MLTLAFDTATGVATSARVLPPVRVAVRLSHVDREHRTIEVESDDRQLLAEVSGDVDARV